MCQTKWLSLSVLVQLPSQVSAKSALVSGLPGQSFIQLDLCLVFLGLIAVVHFGRWLCDWVLCQVFGEHYSSPWNDPAPYVPNGDVYGYSQKKWRVKSKSGHAKPKTGGHRQPLTSQTATHWLARHSLLSGLAIAIYCILWSVSVSAWERWCPISSPDSFDHYEMDPSSPL